MERIGNVGWFVTGSEMEDLVAIYNLLGKIVPRPGCEEGGTITADKGIGVPYTAPESIEIGKICPNCPWSGKEINPWVNPADWTWRPWQAPWYGPGEPVPTDWKIGDGEWWKNSPYCTSSTEDNPNAVKESKTIDNQCQ